MRKLKFGPLIIAATIAGFLGSLIAYRLLARYTIAYLPASGIYGIPILILLTCWGYGMAGYIRARHTKTGIDNIWSFFNVVIVYLLAFDLYSFGWQKIGHLQMVVPLGVLDLPFSSLDGETLTWAYFRRSYPFTVAIAVAQMTGALLILFRRTRLLGLIVIVPILLNIILIDTFYHLHTWVLVHAIMLMSGVIYLLYQYTPLLVTFFFQTSVDALKWRQKKYQQWIAIAVILLLPVILLATYHFPDWHPALTGKYRVEQLKVNNIPTSPHSQKDSVLTTVYMDWQDDFVLEFNHYNSRYIGTYYLDSNTGHISVKWRYPVAFKEKFEGTLLPVNGKKNYTFNGILGSDTLSMQLIKVP